MSNFITKIHINKIFHLENIDIQLDEKEKKHLIITGKNGSGKSVLLNKIVDLLQAVQSNCFQPTDQTVSLAEIMVNEGKLKNLQPRKKLKDILADFESSLKLPLSQLNKIEKKIENYDFLVAFYEARRKAHIVEQKNPNQPNLTPSKVIRDSKVPEFIKFLVDLKTQESFARNENQIEEADKIKNWFNGFEEVLNTIFEGERITLKFNYREYSFTIVQGNKEFGFNVLSDGYSAILDIVADLILKMQAQNSLTRAYEKEGIVLIDEPEAHLHLSLQKNILPMLTKLFPKIQFIVATHSPFVLSSLNKAVAFDLEKKIMLDDLTEYSYDALAEGYFEVSSESNFLKVKLNKYKELLNKGNLDLEEQYQAQAIENEFESLQKSAVAPQHILGEYLQLKLSKK